MEHPSLHGFTMPTTSITHASQPFSIEDNHEQRWYDQDLTTAKAVQALLTFPDALQNIVCQTVLTLLAQHPNAAVQHSQTHTVLSLYRSHKKQRPNNQRELTHSTLTLVGQLPSKQQQALAKTIHELTVGFREYLKLCKQYQSTPHLSEAHHVLAQYLSSGLKGCQNGLQYLAQQYKQRHQAKTQQHLWRFNMSNTLPQNSATLL